MNFEDYCEACVWRNKYSSTIHVLDNEGKHHKTRSNSVGGTWFCGALGLRCQEKICAPFYFLKRFVQIENENREKFLREIMGI